MKIKVGSARINEFGEISGGQAGDQNGKECMIEDCYIHPLGWVIIRAHSKDVRRKIAQDMIYACSNDLIGYDQPKDLTMLEIAKQFGYDCSKVNRPCDTDCAKTVVCCVRYAGIDCEIFYTGNEIEKLAETGEFEIITDKEYCNDMNNYVVGDILCTPQKGHTCVVVATNDIMNTFEFYCNTTESGIYKTRGMVNIREFAGMDAKIVGIIPNNSEVNCVGIVAYETMQNKKWFYVDYLGKRGFASETLLYKKEV